MNSKAIVEPQNSQIGAYFCEAPSDPCAIVMFGASGDLARRKLLPALYDLSYHACLAQRLDELDGEGQLGGNRLYYLATPPEVYLHVIEQLKKAGLNKPKNEKSWARIIIKKPFGHYLESAKEKKKKG